MVYSAFSIALKRADVGYTIADVIIILPQQQLHCVIEPDKHKRPRVGRLMRILKITGHNIIISGDLNHGPKSA